MICYKFTKAEYAFVTLFDRRLKVSRPTEFNDIFEFCPVSEPYSLVRTVLADPTKVRHLYQVEVEKGYTKSFDYFKANDIGSKLVAHLPLVDLAKKDLDARVEASKYIGVVCLCRCSLVYLLWSHYADSHKGCAIGVDVWNTSFGRARVNERVHYATQRPERAWDHQGGSLWEELKKITRTKSKVWAYEREYRLAFPIEELERHGDHCFVALHPQAVRRVVYGEQMDSAFRRRIDELLGHPDYRHVCRYIVKRDARTYSLRLLRLK